MTFNGASLWLIAIYLIIICAAQAGVPPSAPLNATATAARIQANSAAAQAHTAANSTNQIARIMTDGHVTLLQLKNATAIPSQVLRSIQVNGKIYVINQNGIIFGAPRQIDTHALSNAAMKPMSDFSAEEARRLRGRKSDSMISATVVSFGEAEPKPTIHGN
jgi:filamentous hemagglutinin family protein